MPGRSDGLPDVDAAKTYLVSGATLSALISQIRTNRPAVNEEGGLKIEEVSEESGTILSTESDTEGGGDTETITGAVNGVPATLNVKTDGEPWVEIP